MLKFFLLCLFTMSIAGNNPCDFLKPMLGKSFENGADPYKGIYQHDNPTVRYVEQVRAIASRCYLVDNLRVMGKGDDPIHKPGWSSLLVDTTKLKKVYLMANDFPVRVQSHSFNAGHFQMLFEFHPGGALTPQGEIKGFVNTVEAYFPEGESYEPIKAGMGGAYDSVHIFASDDYSFRYVAAVHSGSHMFELDLTQAEAEKLLVTTFRTATNRKAQMSEKYNTATNSCVTSQFKLLNSVLGPEKRVPPFYETFGPEDLKILFVGLSDVVATMLERHGIMRKRFFLKSPTEPIEFLKDYSPKNVVTENTEDNTEKEIDTPQRAFDQEMERPEK
jgi:hypothetical protein